ncbi:helix-turn-helix domain-containing protein [Veillonella sp.]|uniref:helix-turn-helix domain-containing protein n=1 Tax=Veillonella sp. TaxID=1926307 RepID=UPI0025D04DAC|nr:helix-turn-helix domain-containing protein [Veillonella sp.]
MKTIQERIKFIRKEKNLNQEEFGERLGVGKYVIANIELNRVEPKELLINHICDIYSINKEWILNGTGEVYQTTEKNIINDLVKEFDLDEDELSIIKSYINLPKIQRKNFVSILKAMVSPSDEEKTYDEKLNQVANELKVAEGKNEYTASTTTSITKDSTEKRA